MRDGTPPAPEPDEDPAQGQSGSAPDRPSVASELSPDADAEAAPDSEPNETVDPAKPARTAMSERERRRLAAIFGDVLPDTTSDERDPGRPGRDNDAWYRENRPPHHDR